MAYTSWSVVFGEQPSAAKWNILGTNDASFNDGTGIGADAVKSASLFYGLIRNRQGATSGDDSWYTGTTVAGSLNTATDAKDIFIQVGSLATGGTSAFTVTFPTAYTQVPMVFGTATTAGTTNAWFRASAITATGFTAQLINDAGNGAAETCNWLAIGQ